MTNLQLSTTFQNIFKQNFKITESNVLDTYEHPDKREVLENGMTLFMKEFADDHLSTLLVASQEVNNQEMFSFAYWIPKKIISYDISLLDILEIFANLYGCKIKIAGTEAYFFRKTRKLIQGNLESPNQIMKILGSEHIPCQAFIFFKENEMFNLNWVDCYCCFAINNNRYLTWLFNIETTNIKVSQQWYTYLSEIRDVLDPFGKTGLRILSTKKDQPDGLISHNEINEVLSRETDLEITKYYLKPISRIIDVLSELHGSDKIAVIPRFENNKCIFCGAENTNREHIFAIWMRSYFEQKDFDSILYIKLPEEDLLTSRQSGISKGMESSYGYISHRVCVECNGTWMSKLEEKAKSILANDSTNLKNTIDSLVLNEYNSTQLALWIVVKAILLAVKSNLSPILPKGAYQKIQNGVVPEGFLVEIAETETNDLNFIVSRGASSTGSLLRLKKINKTIAEDLTKDFFMANIQIGHFYMRVSYFDDAKGLKREGCIKPTTILFPFAYKLPYFRIENEKGMWDEVDSKLKLSIFSIGISLTDT